MSDKKMNNVKADMSLTKLGWDSLVIINLMTHFTNKHKINLKPNYFEKLKSVKDLDKFIDIKIKKKK